MGSSPVIPDARYVPGLLFHGQFNEASLPDASTAAFVTAPVVSLISCCNWILVNYQHAMPQVLTFEARTDIMDQTVLEPFQASVKDWNFIAITR